MTNQIANFGEGSFNKDTPIATIKSLTAKRVFLRVLANTGDATEAATASGITMVTMLRYRKSDPEFASAWAEAAEAASYVLEGEAVDRALNGTVKEVRYKGQVVGVEQIKSDRLLELLLKRNDRFKPEQKDTTVNVNVGVAVLPSSDIPEDQWEKKAQLTAEENLRISADSAASVIDVEYEEVSENTQIKRK